ncbi:unnamed protein product, partial [Brenthis ino]
MEANSAAILFKEKYGDSKERYYVKPPDQYNIMVLKNEKLSNISGIFTKIFMPQGYPYSVSKDYTAYQIWDTAQAFCSTITGILATQEVLRGMGVGDTNATPLAATVTWVLKDGCGHLGRILFAYSHGTHLDAYSKKWRLFADILNNAAMCIEIALPLFSKYVTFALCISTIMKAIVGVAGGATRAAMTQHHAIRGNMADVAAKDSAQETAVNLVASMVALFIISIFGNSIFIFFLMLILHISFNYLAVRAVCLRSLNEPRFLLVIDEYLKKEQVETPCKINRSEPIILYQLGSNMLDLIICGYQIKLGQSMSQVMTKSYIAMHWELINVLYSDRNYILFTHKDTRVMHVFIKDNGTVDDVLCAYFHAVLLSIVICALKDHHLTIFDKSYNTRPLAQVCQTLQTAEWSRIISHDDKFIEPSFELLKYVHDIAVREWEVLKPALIQAGWDLSKHLLVLDEWRVCSENIQCKQTCDQQDQVINPTDTEDDILVTEVSTTVEELEIYNKQEPNIKGKKIL